MIKKILLTVLCFHFAHGESNFLGNIKDSEKFGEVDRYIKTFNTLISLSRSSIGKPVQVTESSELKSLSPQDKKWLSLQLVKAPPKNIRLSRLGSIVSLVQADSGIVLARFDVEQYSVNGTVSWKGKDYPVRELFSKETLSDQSKFLKKQIALNQGEGKSFKQKALETAFFVLTLPLQLLTACGGMQEGSEGALALASGHNMTPVFENMRIPSDSNSRVSTGDFGNTVPVCTGYSCSNGHRYNLSGDRTH